MFQSIYFLETIDIFMSDRVTLFSYYSWDLSKPKEMVNHPPIGEILATNFIEQMVCRILIHLQVLLL